MSLFKISVPEVVYDAHVFFIEAETKREAANLLREERRLGRAELPMDILGIGWDVEEVCFPVTED